MTILNFWSQLIQTEYFRSKKKGKNGNHHRILHIRISLGFKLQLQETILTFWEKVSPKKDTFDLKQKK